MDVSTLKLDSAVLHEVGKRTGGTVAVTLSQAEAVLTPSDRDFIMLRLIRALQNDRIPVVEADPTATDTGAAIAADILRGQQQLVAGSRALAERLADSQHHMSPEGLLLVGHVHDAAKTQGLLIAKLEHEQGIQAKPQRNNGLDTFAVTVIPDLVLSDSGRVFKVGLFPKPAGPGAVEADVVDRQAGGRSVAHYFLSQYLGCQLLEKPDVMTERFVNGAQKFIASLQDPRRAAEVQVAVLAELQSPKQKINIPQFARDNLLDGEDAEFRQAMTAADAPWRAVVKDTARVKSRIQSVRIKVDSGVLVLAPPETIKTDDNPDGTVDLSSSDGHALVIDGEISDIDGSRSRA